VTVVGAGVSVVGSYVSTSASWTRRRLLGKPQRSRPRWSASLKRASGALPPATCGDGSTRVEGAGGPEPACFARPATPSSNSRTACDRAARLAPQYASDEPRAWSLGRPRCAARAGAWPVRPRQRAPSALACVCGVPRDVLFSRDRFRSNWTRARFLDARRGLFDQNFTGPRAGDLLVRAVLLGERTLEVREDGPHLGRQRDERAVRVADAEVEVETCRFVSFWSISTSARRAGAGVSRARASYSTRVEDERPNVTRGRSRSRDSARESVGTPIASTWDPKARRARIRIIVGVVIACAVNASRSPRA